MPSPPKSKVKALSIQHMTTRSAKKAMDNKAGRSSNSGDHAVSDTNPGFSQRTITKSSTEENRAKSTINPNVPDLDDVTCEGENSFPPINLQESQGNISITS